MQSLRRILPFSHQRHVSGVAKELFYSNFSISRGSGSTMLNPSAVVTGSTCHHMLNLYIRNINLAVRSREFIWSSNFMTQIRSAFQQNTLGRKAFVGTLLGFSLAGGAINSSTNIAHAMTADDMESHLMDSESPSDFIRQDLDTLWALTKKFQLPAVLLLTVIFGWRHPIVLAINVALLLFCTKPSPLSVYIFIEKLRQKAMREKPALSKTRLFYAKKVEVKDFKLLCFARVELRDVNMSLVGILGSWWILYSSSG
ncbi:uncharacterized protein LOC144700746 isoform X2 [Wolffia australiana]